MRTGIDRMICLPFNEQVSQITATSVIEDFLVGQLGVRYVVVGDDFRFGRGREGDYAMLKRGGDRLGFDVSHIGTLTFDHERVSSSRIREALAGGDITLAEKLLGHRFFIMGHVIYGRQLGRQLGVPTANIRAESVSRAARRRIRGDGRAGSIGPMKELRTSAFDRRSEARSRCSKCICSTSQATSTDAC